MGSKKSIKLSHVRTWKSLAYFALKISKTTYLPLLVLISIIAQLFYDVLRASINIDIINIAVARIKYSNHWLELSLSPFIFIFSHYVWLRIHIEIRLFVRSPCVSFFSWNGLTSFLEPQQLLPPQHLLLKIICIYCKWNRFYC